MFTLNGCHDGVTRHNQTMTYSAGFVVFLILHISQVKACIRNVH